MFQLQQLKIFTTTSIIKFRRHQNKFKLGQLETWFFSVCQPSLSGAHYCVSLQSDDNTTETHARCRKCKAEESILSYSFSITLHQGWCCSDATQTSQSSTCQIFFCCVFLLHKLLNFLTHKVWFSWDTQEILLSLKQQRISGERVVLVCFLH